MDPRTRRHTSSGCEYVAPRSRAIQEFDARARFADAIELARTLGTLPARVYVSGVEVRDVSVGVGLTSEVESTLPALLQEVLVCMKHRKR